MVPLKVVSIVLLGVYAIIFVLVFGSSAAGADSMWLPFLLLAVLGSVIQWSAQSFTMRSVGLVLVVLAVGCSIGDVFALRSREAHRAEAKAKAAFVEGRYGDGPMRGK